MIKKIKLLLSVVLLGGLFFGGLSVSAIDTSNMKYMMTISPPRQEMVLMPGETYEGSINVSNPLTAVLDLKYSVHIGSFSLGKDENGNADYNSTDVDTITGYNQIMDWITLNKESGTVAPGSVDVVSYTITVPKNAPAGGQYASIIFRDETQKNNEPDKNIVIQNVLEFAVSILAEIAGQTKDEGTVIENSIPAFLLTNTLSADSIVRNDGNVHTDASYILQVWPLFNDEEICTNEENPSTSKIMPETERYHTESCDKLPMVGIFRAKQTVKIFDATSVIERIVIVCPVWLLFLIIFAITAIIVYFVAKAKARRAEEKD